MLYNFKCLQKVEENEKDKSKCHWNFYLKDGKHTYKNERISSAAKLNWLFKKVAEESWESDKNIIKTKENILIRSHKIYQFKDYL